MVLRAGLRRDFGDPAGRRRPEQESGGSGVQAGQISVFPGLLHRREGQAAPHDDIRSVVAPRRDVPLRHRLPPRLRLQEERQQLRRRRRPVASGRSINLPSRFFCSFSCVIDPFPRSVFNFLDL
ncbi:unnamed protein product [Linum tenue]|nr:unnamed protein product [Linum tenue]CAI0389578.1 unnamed protein product [Linum tenue]